MEVSMSKTRRGKYTDNRICYISKCKGDMRLYLRRKGKLPCFSYLVRGKSFSFYRGKMPLYKKISELSAAKTQSKTPLKIETIYRIERYVCNPIFLLIIIHGDAIGLL